MDSEHKVARPHNCSDPQAWELYYASRIRDGFRHRNPSRSNSAPVSLEELGEIFESIFSMLLPVSELAAELRARGWTSIWVPGCGLSPLPKLLAHLGLAVTATDISEAAVRFQQSAQNDVSVFSDLWEASLGDGSFSCERHDLRTDFRGEAFDAIINVRAFQGFPQTEIGLVARSHFRSLKAGRYAYLYTMNTWNVMKTLEQVLADAGFVVISPFSHGGGP